MSDGERTREILVDRTLRALDERLARGGLVLPPAAWSEDDVTRRYDDPRLRRLQQYREPEPPSDRFWLGFVLGCFTGTMLMMGSVLLFHHLLKGGRP